MAPRVKLLEEDVGEFRQASIGSSVPPSIVVIQISWPAPFPQFRPGMRKRRSGAGISWDGGGLNSLRA